MSSEVRRIFCPSLSFFFFTSALGGEARFCQQTRSLILPSGSSTRVRFNSGGLSGGIKT